MYVLMQVFVHFFMHEKLLTDILNALDVQVNDAFLSRDTSLDLLNTPRTPIEEAQFVVDLDYTHCVKQLRERVSSKKQKRSND